MAIESLDTSQALENRHLLDTGDANSGDILKFKKRMLEWPNPVEYVNNMYGCHPEDNDNEYFKVIFAK